MRRSCWIGGMGVSGACTRTVRRGSALAGVVVDLVSAVAESAFLFERPLRSTSAQASATPLVVHCGKYETFQRFHGMSFFRGTPTVLRADPGMSGGTELD